MDQENNEQQPQEQASAPEVNQESTVAPKRRLGRGLDALLGRASPVHDTQTDDSTTAPVRAGELVRIAVGQIEKNPYQPRRDFNSESIDELSSSISEHGVLQPLLVRELDGGFQLIAGERRLIASKAAGLETVPCQIVDVIDKTAAEYAFEENLKRQDLNDLEKAQAFRDYLSLFEVTVDELAKQLSMSRSAVSNTMRLLDLPSPVKNMLQSGDLTAGHARALLPLDAGKQLEFAKQIKKEGWNVRTTEKNIKAFRKGEEPQPEEQATESTAKPQLTDHLKDLLQQLRSGLGMPVDFRLKDETSGQVIIHFSTLDEFDRVTEALRSGNSEAPQPLENQNQWDQNTNEQPQENPYFGDAA